MWKGRPRQKAAFAKGPDVGESVAPSGNRDYGHGEGQSRGSIQGPGLALTPGEGAMEKGHGQVRPFHHPQPGYGGPPAQPAEPSAHIRAFS